MNVLYIISGILILILGGELLVRGAVNVALRFHISTLVVGMTVVSFGTSAPELLVSLEAMFSGHPGIAVGNVVGSNIANLALVLGVTAIIFPIQVSKNSYKLDWPMLMFSSFLVLGFMWMNYDPMMGDGYDAKLTHWNGWVMVALLIWFSVYLIRKSRKHTKAQHAVEEFVPDVPKTSIWIDILYIVLGSLGLSVGAHFLVQGTVGLATVLGISDYVISVTVVAFGTSLPELITSAVAAFKRQSDLSVGNLIGSNIFNILGILGVTAIFKEIPISSRVLNNDMWWVIGVSAIIFPLMITGKRINKWEGGALLLIYSVYIYFVVTKS
jgi:cation:H+ antiporter